MRSMGEPEYKLPVALKQRFLEMGGDAKEAVAGYPELLQRIGPFLTPTTGSPSRAGSPLPPSRGGGRRPRLQ